MHPSWSSTSLLIDMLKTIDPCPIRSISTTTSETPLLNIRHPQQASKPRHEHRFQEPRKKTQTQNGFQTDRFCWQDAGCRTSAPRPPASAIQDWTQPKLLQTHRDHDTQAERTKIYLVTRCECPKPASSGVLLGVTQHFEQLAGLCHHRE